MTLSHDEIKDVFEKYLRLNIDVAQGMNYCINSKYEVGTQNFLQAIKTLEDIIEKIKY